ncbi:MAG: hypothetical protein WCL16_10620 [bacterium]
MSMVRASQVRMHELELCGDIKSLADAMFTTHAEWPFSHAKIEQWFTGARTDKSRKYG